MSEAAGVVGDVTVSTEDALPPLTTRRFSRTSAQLSGLRSASLANPRRTRLDADGKPLAV